VSSTSHFSEAQKEKERDRLEIEQYGRMWIWEGYCDPKNRDHWLTAAEKLNHINTHVLEDIEDYILMKGY